MAAPATSPRAALARCAGLSVVLGGTTVLHDVDLEVRTGEVLALVGPNGAGKSTLLAALSGDLRRHAGTVEVDGRAVARWTPRELAQRRAVLPQQHLTFFSFSVDDVVRMGRSPWRPDPEVDDRVVAEAVALTRVEHLLHRSVSTLSGGERARVHLARVLAQDTALLLLDEPTAALDLHHQEVVLQVARSRADAGRAVVVVLHDLDLAASYADRVALLSRGALVADAPTVDVLRAELLSEVYGHAVEVITHPRTGRPVVLPVR